LAQHYTTRSSFGVHAGIDFDHNDSVHDTVDDVHDIDTDIDVIQARGLPALGGNL
jgi:hypothetical protein